MNDMSRAAVRVACDVGGTFTDVCVLDQATGQMRVAKTPTTPDPIDGVLNGIKAGGVDLRDMVLFAHGTTLATNALITRNFPPAIMVTTKGFRDVIEIRRGTRDDLWDTYKEMAPPYIQRRNRLVVTERIDYSGTVIEPVIGIGGHLTMPPLPHHRAYGSVPRRFDRIRPQQGCRVWGGRASRNGGCVGPAGPPHVRPCASTPSASQRRWRLGPLRVPGGGAP